MSGPPHPARVVVRPVRRGGGAVVEMNLLDVGASTHARFSTAGMTPAEVRAKKEEIERQHALKASRHVGFNRMDRTVKVGPDSFFIYGLAIAETGGQTRVLLYVKTPSGEKLNLSFYVGSVDQVPIDEEIRARVKDAAADYVTLQRLTDNHVQQVKAAVGV